MAVKTITIKEDAYNVLSSMKKPDESFSDVILRIGSEKPCTAKDLFGKLKLSGKEYKEMKKHIKEIREQMDKEMEARHRVFARHLRDV